MVNWPHLHNYIKVCAGLWLQNKVTSSRQVLTRFQSSLFQQTTLVLHNCLCMQTPPLQVGACPLPLPTGTPISAIPPHLIQSLQPPHILTLTHEAHLHSQTHTSKSMSVHTPSHSLHQRKPPLTLRFRQTSRAGTTFQRSGKQASRKHRGATGVGGGQNRK